DQAEQRPVAALGHELGVDAEHARLAGALGDLRYRRVVGHRLTVMGRILILSLITLACVSAGCSDSQPGAEPPSDAASTSEEAPRPSRPQVVQALPPGAEAPVGPPEGPDIQEPDVLPEREEKPENIAATDAELTRELADLRRAPSAAGGAAVLQPDGTASPP